MHSRPTCTLEPVDAAAALACGSTTRPPLPQPGVSAVPLLLGSGPSRFEASRLPSRGPPKAADARQPAHRYVRATAGEEWLKTGSVAVAEGGSLMQAAYAQRRLVIRHATKISKRCAA